MDSQLGSFMSQGTPDQLVAPVVGPPIANQEDALHSDPNSDVVATANTGGVPDDQPLTTSNATPSLTDENTGTESESLGALGDTFLSSVVLLLGMTVAQKAIGFLRTIIVCRLLPPEEMGMWAMLQTTIATILPILLLSIPACFGRYFEFYRGRQQLRAFLRQATLLCSGLLVAGIGLLVLLRQPIAGLTLGSTELGMMIVASAIALVPFAIFCFLTEMLTALRFSRLTTAGHFINGTTLAVISVGLLFSTSRTAMVMLFAFGAAHLLALLWLITRLRPVLKSVPTDRQKLSFVSTWSGMVPIILLFWFNDFMTNMFNMSDRYMLVNLLPGSHQEVMEQIGNYESGHIIPVLFATVTMLIAKTLMPYLANAWEKQDFRLVSQQTNLSLKLVTCVTVLGGLMFLPTSGFVFDTIFQGKYDGGAAVLPYVVFFYVGSGFTALIMNYFWCAHRAPWAILALVLGVAINVSVNLLLVQRMGIVGAAIGTVFGIACQVVCLWTLAVFFGMKLDRGTVVLSLSSVLLLLNTAYWPLWCLIVVGALFAPGVLDADDRTILGNAAQTLRTKLSVLNGLR